MIYIHSLKDFTAELNGEYMKKIVSGLLLSALIAFSFPALSETAVPVAPATAEAASSNVIDKAFAKSFDQAENTAEINYVHEKYLEAWKAEMANASEQIKKTFTHKEDKQRLDDYLSLYENLAQKAFDLEMLNWLSCDLSDPLADRSFGTGATGAAMIAQARIYKQATQNLIDYMQGNPDAAYQFIYSGDGADLKKIREQ